MVLVSDLDIPVVDLTTPDSQQGFHEAAQRELAAGSWLLCTPPGYSVISYDAIRDIARNPRVATIGVMELEMQHITSGPAYEWNRRLILNLDGSEHRRKRRAIIRAFGRDAVANLTPVMQQFMQQRVARLRTSDSCDFIAEVAQEYPIAMICALVGAPLGDWKLFSGWATDLVKQFDPDIRAHLADIENTIEEMNEYFTELVRHRWNDPVDDLLGELIGLARSTRSLNEQEVVDLAQVTLLAGSHTTRNQLSLAMYRLALQPTEWERLASDPPGVPGAVEELLRFDPAITSIPRVVTDDLVYRGVEFPAGTVISLVAMTGNRDPSVVSCPMTLDMTSDRGDWSTLGFGAGAHMCPGAQLARAEIREATLAMTQGLTNVSVAAEPSHTPWTGIAGLTSLVLRYEPR